MQAQVDSLEDLKKFAETLVKKLMQHQTPRVVVLLKGDPGVGKTELVKACVAALSHDELAENPVASPTFALHHQYQIHDDKNIELSVDHWDLYRLQGEDDLESSGFWDQFSDPQFLIFIEWPERLNPEWIPQNLDLWQIELQRIEGKASSRSIFWSELPRVAKT